MPTPQSPSARTPSRPQTPSHNRPLTPLSYLSSPAPDLAATLHATSQAADEADEANSSFLRRSMDSLERARSRQQQRGSYVDAQRDPRPRAQTAESEASTTTAEDVSRRERLHRVLARLNRFHEPGTASSTSAAAYTNRTPSPNRQSIYDWAPSYDDPAEAAGENELEDILLELRRQQPDTHPDILRILGQSQLDGSRQQREQHREARDPELATLIAAERRNRARERERLSTRETEWQSLRNRAVMQRVRQEGAGSPSATERMLRYVMERERSGMSEEEERARGSGWFRPNPSRGTAAEETHRSMDQWTLPPPTSDLRERDRQERVDAFRRGYLAENAPPRLPRVSTPPVSATAVPKRESSTAFLANALQYLSELRDCTQYEEALTTAIDRGLATKEFFADKHDDFVMDLEDVPPLPYTSWLQPGMTFEGHQYATGYAGVTQQDVSDARSRIEQINPNFQPSNQPSGRWHDHPPGSTRVVPFDATRPWLSHTPPAAAVRTPSNKVQPQPQHDHWPVRVLIHAVDPETMTLQGTMEAYDVPQHTAHLPTSADPPRAGRKSAPITTYLEGHIIDLRTHSLLTPDGPKDAQHTRGPRRGPHMTSSTNMTPYTTLPQDINFPSASPKTDGENWLKLPPFLDLANPDIEVDAPDGAYPAPPDPMNPPESNFARLLLSKTHLAQLSAKYVLMKWKEKCFVHTRQSTCTATVAERQSDRDRGHGLTISGFYYVSLERATGRVEGVYFDPGSTPCQFLRLEGAGGGNVGIGAWEMK